MSASCRFTCLWAGRKSRKFHKICGAFSIVRTNSANSGGLCITVSRGLASWSFKFLFLLPPPPRFLKKFLCLDCLYLSEHLQRPWIGRTPAALPWHLGCSGEKALGPVHGAEQGQKGWREGKSFPREGWPVDVLAWSWRFPSTCLNPQQPHLISHLTLHLAGTTPRAPYPLSFMFFFVFLTCPQRRTLYRHRRYLSLISRLGKTFILSKTLVLPVLCQVLAMNYKLRKKASTLQCPSPLGLGLLLPVTAIFQYCWFSGYLKASGSKEIYILNSFPTQEVSKKFHGLPMLAGSDSGPCHEKLSKVMLCSLTVHWK